MTLLYLIIPVIYLLFISQLIYGFDKIENYNPSGLKPKTKFSIIVPFRNEAKNLPILLDSFSRLNYPIELFQLILVDDASDKEYVAPDTPYTIKIINNIRTTNSPKKDAILTAVNLVNAGWIVTTDADCVVHPDWLHILDNYIQQKEPEMIAGAVSYHCNTSFLHHFQQLDMASLQGATIGSFGINKPFMCNGANFAYTKKIFQELNGFQGNDSVTSGDDVFLLQKCIARFPEKIAYLKSEKNIVLTKPLDSWKTLFYQRVRWASKTTSYKNNFGKTLALIVFFGNLWTLSLVFFLFATLKFEILLLFLFSKFVVDTVLIYKTNTFLKAQTTNLFLGSLLYPFFSTSVAIYSLFGRYEWKGRTFKK